MNRWGTFAIIAIFLIISGTILGTLGWPLWQSIQLARADRNQAEAMANTLEAQRERLTKFITQKESNEKLRRRLEEAIPSQPQTDQLIVHLERLAAGLGLRLNVVDLESGQVGDKKMAATSWPAGITPIIVTVDVAGSYPAIQNWVRQLALGDRLIEVSNLVLADQADLGVDARMTLETFWKKEPTVEIDAASLTIDAQLRELLLGRRDLMTLPPAASPTSGRVDPFAAVP